MTSQKRSTTETITGIITNILKDSQNKQGLPYEVGEVCMVSQTLRCLQYHPARITNIEHNLFEVKYLTTSLSDVLPGGIQIQKLGQVGRGVKRCSERPIVRQETAIAPTKIINHHHSILQAPNTSLYHINLARWKRQRKQHIWGNEGNIAAKKTTYYYASVSLIVLEVIWTP